jgi:hypothetical protein
LALTGSNHRAFSQRCCLWWSGQIVPRIGRTATRAQESVGVMGAAPERMLGAVRTVNMDAPPAWLDHGAMLYGRIQRTPLGKQPYTRLGGVQAVGDEHDPATHLLELIHDQADMAHACRLSRSSLATYSVLILLVRSLARAS